MVSVLRVDTHRTNLRRIRRTTTIRIERSFVDTRVVVGVVRYRSRREQVRVVAESRRVREVEGRRKFRREGASRPEDAGVSIEMVLTSSYGIDVPERRPVSLNHRAHFEVLESSNIDQVS